MHNPEQLTQLVAALIASGDHKIYNEQHRAVYALILTNKARELAYEINKFYCACGDIIAPDHDEYADTVANGCCSGCEAGEGAKNTVTWHALSTCGKGCFIELGASASALEFLKAAKELIADDFAVSIDSVCISKLERIG